MIIKRLLLNTLVVFTTLICSFFLLLPFLPTSSFPLLNVFSPFVPYVLGMTLPVLIIFIICRHRLGMTVTAGIALVSIPIFLKTYSFGEKELSNDMESSISLLTYNTTFFNVPTIFKKDYFDPNYNHTVLEAKPWIKSLDADIICLQEFFNDVNSPFYNTLKDMENAGYQRYFFSMAKHDNGVERGLVIFSKYPILSSGLITRSQNNYNAAIYADLLIESDTLRLINVHLKSLAFRNRSSNPLKRAAAFVSHYKAVSWERSMQMDTILSFMNASRHPLVVAGDFNETPYSNTFKRISQVLENAHQTAGAGFGNTFPLSGSLGVRIDHVFSSEEVKMNYFETQDDIKFSEHYPSLAVFSLN